MDKIIESIVNKDYEEANGLIKEEIGKIVLSKLHEMKKMIAARNSTLSEAIVHPDGLVHLATGEMILPSVWKHRRGLSEMNWEHWGAKQHAEAEKGESEIDDLRKKEWDRGIVGRKTAIQYKKDREKLMDNLYDDAVKRYGNDHESIARDVHSKILQNHSNEGVGAFYVHAHKFEDLHPSVREYLMNGARRAVRHAEDMKDPAKAARHKESLRIQTEFEARMNAEMNADREQHNNAMSKFLEQQKARLAKTSAPKTPEGKIDFRKVTGNDEIPY